MIGKELIWVSKELAKEFKQLDSAEEQEKAVKKIINEKSLDLEREQEHLSESMLIFKSVCLAHKKELEKVYEAESSKIEKLWEDCGDTSKKIREYSDKLANELKPIKNEIECIRRSIGELKKELQ